LLKVETVAEYVGIISVKILVTSTMRRQKILRRNVLIARKKKMVLVSNILVIFVKFAKVKFLQREKENII
jgi:hypothetical protein